MNIVFNQRIQCVRNICFCYTVIHGSIFMEFHLSNELNIKTIQQFIWITPIVSYGNGNGNRNNSNEKSKNNKNRKTKANILIYPNNISYYRIIICIYVVVLCMYEYGTNFCWYNTVKIFYYIYYMKIQNAQNFKCVML